MADLPDSRYAVVVIDPPWDSGGYLDGARGNFYRRKGGAAERPAVHRNHEFPVLTDAEIVGLPVPKLLLPDSFVFLWVVQNRLPIAFDIINFWSLRYKFTMTWCKPNGPRPTGFPAYNSEFCIVATRGRPKFISTKGFFTAAWWDQQRIHGQAAPGAWGRQVRACEKPTAFYQQIASVCPGPRLDMFARRQIDGFEAWGNEVP